MNTVETLLCELSALYEQTGKRPFPYDDIRALRQVMPVEFEKHDPDKLITADLNEHLMLISGLSSGGLRTRLSDAGDRYRIKQLLSGSFFERYPRYRFLEELDLTEYPHLNAELVTAERLRRLILTAIVTLERRQRQYAATRALALAGGQLGVRSRDCAYRTNHNRSSGTFWRARVGGLEAVRPWAPSDASGLGRNSSELFGVQFRHQPNAAT